MAGVIVYFGWVTAPRAQVIAAITIGIFNALAFALLSETIWNQHAVGVLLIQSVTLTAVALSVIAKIPQKPVVVPAPPEAHG